MSVQSLTQILPLLKLGDQLKIAGCDYGEVTDIGEDFVSVLVKDSDDQGFNFPFYAELYTDDEDLEVEKLS